MAYNRNSPLIAALVDGGMNPDDAAALVPKVSTAIRAVLEGGAAVHLAGVGTLKRGKRVGVNAGSPAEGGIRRVHKACVVLTARADL